MMAGKDAVFLRYSRGVSQMNRQKLWAKKRKACLKVEQLNEKLRIIQDKPDYFTFKKRIIRLFKGE